MKPTVVCTVLAMIAALVTACGNHADRASESEEATPTTPLAGTVSTTSIPAASSGFAARDAHLYLPPGYRPGQQQRLPVLIMLAGVPGDTGDWFTNADLQPELDAFATQHGGRAPIVVAPDDTGTGDEDLLCMDSPKAKLDTYLSQDVPQWITQHLAADPDTHHWAVGGLSYGGTCAYELAVRHPALFPTFLDFSGEKHPMHDTVASAVDDVFDGDSAAYRRQDPLAILATRTFPGSAGVIAVGDDDEPYTSEQQIVLEACRRAGMQVEWRELPGGHDWSLWAEFFRQALPWLAQRLSLDRPAR
ncbi:hypothetical protein FNH07_02760 [Amycolatopsis bartoniae]|uniref:Esterase family protein n=2 Tax=Amycolatopsis bartoniae TaxID=941986 RepID=A0A8H9MF04_9PSEU|nr:hypothetical protein FNH07_02760 [Amycolatopsis bartoniae]GHF66734.1 hypothetical protein GCM10017566_45680 [Amycolatopsis bartoniae]